MPGATIMIYRMAILNGDRKGQQITIPEESMTIGRGSDCGFCLNDPEIANTHAVVEHSAQGLRIRDLGSMGKLLVNNRAVRDCSLKHGDIVELGHTRMLVQAVVEAEVRAAFDYPLVGRRRRAAAVVLLAACGVAAMIVWRASHSGGPEIVLSAGEQEPEMVKIPDLQVVAKAPAAAAEAVVADNPAPASARDSRDALADLAAPADADPIGLAAEAVPAPAPPPPAVQGSDAGDRPDPYVLAQAMVDDTVRGMMMDAHLLIASNQYREADELLGSILRLAPEYLEAHAERAWLYEDQGMLEPALAEWRKVIQVGGNESLLTTARERLAKLGDARREVQPKFGGRVRVESTEQKKFPESKEMREMRIVTVQLAAADPMQAPDAKAVKVDVLFYDRDMRTGSIRRTRATGENRDLKVPGPWQQGEMKSVTATYMVPVAMAPAGTRAEQFYGYVVRVYHFGALQDQSAQPSGLLVQVASPGGGGEPGPLANTDVGALSRHAP